MFESKAESAFKSIDEAEQGVDGIKAQQREDLTNVETYSRIGLLRS